MGLNCEVKYYHKGGDLWSAHTRTDWAAGTCFLEHRRKPRYSFKSLNRGRADLCMQTDQRKTLSGPTVGGSGWLLDP